MKKTTIASLMATAILLPQLASGAILLAGFHDFTATTGNINGAGDSKAGADGGVFATGTGATGNTGISVLDVTGFGPNGGSLDGWYGPDSTGNGGLQVSQTGDITTAFSPAGGYKPEVVYVGNTTNDRFDNSPPFSDLPFTATSQSGTNMDGRITTAIGTFTRVNYNAALAAAAGLVTGPGGSLQLQSFVFDAFLGDASFGTNPIAIIDTVTTTIVRAAGGSQQVSLPVTAAYSGLNTRLDDTSLTGVNTPLDLNTVVSVDGVPATGAVVNNRIDFGTGTNYLDYVVDLSSITLLPGDSISFQVISHGQGTVVRLDNLALFAVPEPSSVMTLAALVGTGCFFRRRKLASAI